MKTALGVSNLFEHIQKEKRVEGGKEGLGLTLSHHLAVRNFTKEKKNKRLEKRRGNTSYYSSQRGSFKEGKNDPEKKNPHLGNNSDILSSTRKPI